MQIFHQHQITITIGLSFCCAKTTCGSFWKNRWLLNCLHCLFWTTVLMRWCSKIPAIAKIGDGIIIPENAIIFTLWTQGRVQTLRCCFDTVSLVPFIVHRRPAGAGPNHTAPSSSGWNSIAAPRCKHSRFRAAPGELSSFSRWWDCRRSWNNRYYLKPYPPRQKCCSG